MGPRLTFAREPFAQWHEEAFPLFKRQHAELHRHGFDLEPDCSLGMTLEANNKLLAYTARADGVLVGYAIFIVCQMAHYKSKTVAELDLMWLEPEHRAGVNGIKFIRFIEADIANHADIMRLRAKPDTSLSALAPRLGFQKGEVVFDKAVR